MSDIASHFLIKHGISAIRRIRKTDNNRIARASGATIVNRTDSLKEEHIGTGAGLFEVCQLDLLFTFGHLAENLYIQNNAAIYKCNRLNNIYFINVKTCI